MRILKGSVYSLFRCDAEPANFLRPTAPPTFSKKGDWVEYDTQNHQRLFEILNY